MDPSFDDLLDSLDAIQNERTHQRRDSSSSSSSSSSDEDKKHKHHDDHDHHDHHEEFSLGLPHGSVHADVDLSFHMPPPPPVHHSPPAQHSTVHIHHSPPPSHDSHHDSHHDHGHHASHDHAPAASYSAPVHHHNPAAAPSRSGDVKQYQRQSIIQPATRSHQGSSDTHCAKCNNSLYGTEYVTAGGKNYHQEHFTCVKCGTKILGAYYDHHSQVHCPQCAGDLLPCTKCHRGITGQYMVLEGRPYHNECMDRKHCAACHGPIEDTVLTALGKTWHQRCFKCIQCGRELGKEFISKDGHGQCTSCADRARPTCAKCHNPLSGEFINFQNASYHQNCFVCTQCRSPLGTSGFYNVGGQLKCGRCAK